MNNLSESLKKELKVLEGLSLRREPVTISGAQGPVIRIDGADVVNFASNDYLSLANHPRVRRAAVAAVEEYGLGAGASRLMSGTMEPHRELEEAIAAFKGTEAALVYSSGYAANAGILQSLLGRDDLVLFDRLNHASLYDGCRLSRASLRRYPHGDVDALKGLLQKSSGVRRKLIVTDSVFSMDGDLAPLPEICGLAEKYGADVMVDEAHAIGVLGEGGRGAVEQLGVEGRVRIQMGTLSKALGGLGGYVAGSKDLIDTLVNRSRSFIYSTALPPALARAAMEALRLVQEEPERRQRLLLRAAEMRDSLAAAGFDTQHSQTPIIPVLVGENQTALRFSRQLLEAGFFCPAIRPPTVPPGSSRLRLSVNYGHDPEELLRAAGRIKEIGLELGVI